MKRILQFSLTFLIMLVVVYTYPLVFSDKKQVQDDHDSSVPVLHKSLPYHELNPEGFAEYVDKPVENLKQKFGEPTRIETTQLGYDWWIYKQKNPETYFQVGVSDNKVVTVFALEAPEAMKPFEIGMTLSDTADKMSISSVFSFMYHDSLYELELAEEDMNYRPLIAFSNGTFAILHFNQENGRLLAVRYVNKKTLLSIMPYQLNRGKRQQINTTPQAVEVDTTTLEKNMLEILNVLRKRQKQMEFKNIPAIQQQATTAINQIYEHPETVLEGNTRVNDFHEEVNNATNVYGTPFTLTSEEYKRLLQAANISENTHSIYITPAYDVPWIVLSWYGDASHQVNFNHKKDHQVGVVFSKGSMLFLINEDTHS